MKKRISKKKFKFSKFKVIRNFIIIGVILFIFFTVKCNAITNNDYKTIIVSNGSTLWDISKEEKNTNEYYKNKDLRFIIKDIKLTNNLKTSNIYKNQKLLIKCQ